MFQKREAAPLVARCRKRERSKRNIIQGKDFVQSSLNDSFIVCFPVVSIRWAINKDFITSS